MSKAYDVVVIGSGLGGLTAAALLAQAGRKTLLIERNASVGGAASTYRVGNLLVEASLHETSDPRNPADPRHHILTRLGVLEAVEWVPVGSFYEVRGGPVGAPFLLLDNFASARAALGDRLSQCASGRHLWLRAATTVGPDLEGHRAFAEDPDSEPLPGVRVCRRRRLHRGDPLRSGRSGSRDERDTSRGSP